MSIAAAMNNIIATALSFGINRQRFARDDLVSLRLRFSIFRWVSALGMAGFESLHRELRLLFLTLGLVAFGLVTALLALAFWLALALLAFLSSTSLAVLASVRFVALVIGIAT